MIIGIDFDNTIIKYDNVFGQVAYKKKIINDVNLKTKNQVKNFLISVGREKDWTKLQGIVYGSHIMEAKPYEGFLLILRNLLKSNHTIKIISHKTKYPFIGPQVNLRDSAMLWLKNNNIVGVGAGKIPKNEVFFCDTINTKIKMIQNQKCETFIDDLGVVLDGIDPKLNRILFAPDSEKTNSNFLVLTNWRNVENLLNGFSSNA